MCDGKHVGVLSFPPWSPRAGTASVELPQPGISVLAASWSFGEILGGAKKACPVTCCNPLVDCGHWRFESFFMTDEGGHSVGYVGVTTGVTGLVVNSASSSVVGKLEEDGSVGSEQLHGTEQCNPEKGVTLVCPCSP